MAAGAFGVATSRTNFHRTGDGQHIPSFEAEGAELEALAAAVGRSGRGIVQMIPNLSAASCTRELDLLIRLARAAGPRFRSARHLLARAGAS
jgi:N-acyl-D-aspartate/D-glutamate deacylase